MAKHSKRYNGLRDNLDRDKMHEPLEAIRTD